MPSIDFYLLPTEEPQARLLFACRLLEKAYTQQHHIYVHLENAEKTQAFDNLLWTFRDESFIPHALYTQTEAHNIPILLGHETAPPAQKDILLNLRPDTPVFHAEFKRILEIISADANMRHTAEEHRVFYEEKGYKVTMHQLNK